jgi:crossover junction endodeoxyribonuclease RusA
MTVASFSLPFPPSVNNLYASAGGRRVKSRHYVSWQRDALWRIKLLRQPSIRGQVMVTIYGHPKDRRKRDIDNIVKPILDTLVRAGIIEDDRHVVKLRAEWAGRWNPPFVRVRIEELVPNEQTSGRFEADESRTPSLEEVRARRFALAEARAEAKRVDEESDRERLRYASSRAV